MKGLVYVLKSRIEECFKNTKEESIALHVGNWSKKTYEKYQRELPEYKFVRKLKGILEVRRSENGI